MLAGADVRRVGAAAGHVVVEVGEGGQRGVAADRRPPAPGLDDGVAPRHLGPLHPDQVERDAVAGSDALGALVEALDGPDAGRSGVRTDDDLVAHRQRAPGERARHDRPAALRREHTVDPQAGAAAVAGRGRGGDQLVQGSPEVVQAGARDAADRHHRRGLQERARDVVGHVQRGQLEPLGVDDVGLRQGDDAVADAQQLQDAQVLLALGLPTLGGGDDEQAGVDRAHPGQHVAKETNVTGHVDEADRLAGREHGVGEAEVDRQPPPLLLLEPVRVRPGEGQHQRGLAVVDVPGGRHHPHGRAGDRAASAFVSVASSAGSTVRRSR